MRFNLQKTRFFSFLLALAVFTCTFFSCAPRAAVTQEDSICVTDALGREVWVKKDVQRVGALLGSFADVWSLAGGRVSAAPSDAWEDFGLSLPDAVNLGGAHSPSLELLLSAEPELVLASASTASHVAMREVLEAAKIPVLFFDVDNFEEYLSMLKTCTDITGREDLYRQNGMALAAEIAEIRGAYADGDTPLDERRILLLRASSTAVKAKGSRGTILGEMLLDMGCVNIADGGLLDTLSVEAVMQAEPYHIFVVTMGNDTEAARASLDRMMAEDPAWGSLSAVKEGRVHVMDKTLFNLKPNARFAEAYRTLYEALTKK